MQKITLEYQDKFIKFDTPGGFNQGNYRVSIFYIDVKELGKIDIKTDANVRSVSDTQSTDDMLDTLIDPSKAKRFWSYNGGLIILAKRVINKPSNNKVEIEIPQEYGLVNGGHTQYAIKKALKKTAPTDAWVRVEVIEGEFSNDDIADIAEARNTSKNVKDMSIAWKQGKFKKLRKKLDPNLDQIIDWTTNLVEAQNIGLTAACTGEQLIAKLMLFDIDNYPQNKPPVSYSTSVHRPFSEWLHNIYDYEYLNPICNEVCLLHDKILSTFHDKPKTSGLLNCKFQGKDVFPKKYLKNTPFYDFKTSRKMPDGVLLPLLSSFRVLIEHNKTNKRVRWMHNPIDTWNAAKKDLMQTVVDTVKPAKSVLEVRKSINYWKLGAGFVHSNATGPASSWEKY